MAESADTGAESGAEPGSDPGSEGGDPATGQTRPAGPRRKRRRHLVLKIVGVAFLVLALAVTSTLFIAYRHLQGNIEVINPDLGHHRPKVVVQKALNMLLLGSDTRRGQTGVRGQSNDLSDTTILLHLSADRSRAYGVSVPRDLIVRRPACPPKKAGGHRVPRDRAAMWNSAYEFGGAGCTIRTFEKMTNIHVDHWAVVKFDGFKSMVDALGGVPVCVPKTIDDPAHQIYLKAGTYDVTGNQALTYVRARYGIGDGSDVGRMKRQQAFLAAMTNKVVSLGTLANPVKLYKFLDAATKSLALDPGLRHLKDVAHLAGQLRDIGLGQVQFLTMPIAPDPTDPNRLVPGPGAKRLWQRVRMDRPLTRKQLSGAAKASNHTRHNPSGVKAGQPGKAAQAEAVGLCG